MATEINKGAMRIVKDLKIVKEYGKFPKDRTYMYSKYRREGLVKMGYKTTKTGHKVMDKVILTKKGKGIAGLKTKW